MLVGLFAKPAAWHQQWLGAFAKGLDVHGVEYFIEDGRAATACDLAVFWSHRQKNLIQMQKGAGKNYLVLERGFIGDRQKFTSTGFNGLCGNAQWVTNDSPKRFSENHYKELKPWKPKGTGDYILVIGQVRGDEAIVGVDFEGWLASLVAPLEKFGLPVYFRPHPLDGAIKRPFETIEGTLEDALEGARFCVTYSSTVGVQSVLSGVPTVSIGKGSMAYDVTGHDFEQEPPRVARMDWLSRLAWCQFEQHEFESGAVWAHLRGFL